VASALAILVFAGPAMAITITFEEGVGKDYTAINIQYTGVTFIGATTGESWVYLDSTTGNWQISSWPSGQVMGGGGYYWINDYAAAFTTESGGSGRVNFDAQDATFVDINYCSAETFYMEAYDASDNLLDSTSGPANRRYLEGNENGPGTLSVTAPVGQTIAYVMVHDTGNYWVVDNLVTDATGITVVPEPVTATGLLLGVGCLARYVRRRRR
jgi:hypothetical protein